MQHPKKGHLNIFKDAGILNQQLATTNELAAHVHYGIRAVKLEMETHISNLYDQMADVMAQLYNG